MHTVMQYMYYYVRLLSCSTTTSNIIDNIDSVIISSMFSWHTYYTYDSEHSIGTSTVFRSGQLERRSQGQPLGKLTHLQVVLHPARGSNRNYGLCRVSGRHSVL